MGTAQVESIDAIKDFRVYLTKFRDIASRALSDADSDINRMGRWLEGEGVNYWNTAIRKRQEAVVKAEEAYRQKKLYKDASGSQQSAVEEMKVLKNAKQRLEEAQVKLKAVKHWTRELQKQTTLYRGQVSGFSNDVASGVPEAIGYLGALLEQLDKYMDLTAATGEEAAVGVGAGGAGREAGEASMSRAADEAPKDDGIDPAELRASIPSEQAISQATAAESGSINFASGQITPDQAVPVAKLTEGNPSPIGEIIVAANLSGRAHIVLARISSPGGMCYIGPVDGAEEKGYNKISAGDLHRDRPDLAELLKLPAGFMAVIGAGGVEKIFDPSNQNVFKP